VKRLMVVLSCFLVCLLLPVTGWAQPATPVPIPTPSTTMIAFDHDGINTDGYKIKIDTAAAVAITPTCVPGPPRTCEFPFPAMTPGNHSFVVIAWNIAGEAASAPYAVSMVVVPMVPISIRVIVRLP